MEWQFDNHRPIWMQLHKQLTQRIATGYYPLGSKLPTVRELATQAGVNPNTVQRAMSNLEGDGLIVTNRTTGRTVTDQEDILQAVRDHLARESVAAYFASMDKLGFSRPQAVEQVTRWKEDTK